MMLRDVNGAGDGYEKPPGLLDESVPKTCIQGIESILARL